MRSQAILLLILVCSIHSWGRIRSTFKSWGNSIKNGAKNIKDGASNLLDKMTPSLVVKHEDVPVSADLKVIKSESSRDVVCSQHEVCSKKMRCGQFDKVQRSKEVLVKKGGLRVATDSEIRRWGRGKLCNIINWPCTTTLRGEVKKWTEDVAVNVDRCAKSDKETTLMVSDNKVVGKGNNLSAKCDVSALSKSASCKGLTFHVGYTVTTTYGDIEIPARTGSLNLSQDSDFNVDIQLGKDVTDMKPRSVKTVLGSGSTDSQSKKEDKFIRELAKSAGKAAANELGRKSDISIKWG